MFNSTVANKGSETKEALGQIYETEEVFGETDRGLTISAMSWAAAPETQLQKRQMMINIMSLCYSCFVNVVT